jgi:hypothetical protein
MALEDNKGFLYEGKLNKLLKEYGLEKKSFMGAGADSNAPDGLLTINKIDYKLEIKLDLKVDFGQGSLDYDLNKKQWVLGGAKTASGEAMREFLTDVGVPKMVNQAWGRKGPPRKFTVPLDKFTPKDVAFDYANFKDQFVNVDPNAISNYYASKKTYYIQIGTRGLYYMGKDAAKLGCSKFTPSVRLRIRLKRGGSHPIYNYRFSTALQVVSLTPSSIDLDNEDDLKAMQARNKK